MAERDPSRAPRRGDAESEPVIDVSDASVPAAEAEAAHHLAEPEHVSGRPEDLTPGYRLVTIDGGDRWLEAEAVVYERYRAIGYTEPNEQRRVEELARFADRSRFHVVIDDRDSIIGTIRNIYGDYQELPVGQFQRTRFHHRDPVCELSSLVVDPQARRTGVIEHLYRAGWLDAWRHGSNAVVGLIDEWLFDAFCSIYRLPFERIGVARNYMGTHPAPVGMGLEGRLYENLARENPEFWAWTLEAVTGRELWAWDLPVPVFATQQDAPHRVT